MPDIASRQPFRVDPHYRQRKKNLKPSGRWTEDSIESARDALFNHGSEYLTTLREEIAGIDNVLIEIDEVIHAIVNHQKYQSLHARLEPGVIFEGEPGTGKTLVSRYIATASNALFISIRDFPHLGTIFTDADIRDLFARARDTYAKNGKPIILFWDEFENAAISREDATPEQAAAVSQLTAELDGIHGKNAGVLLVGCTNYIHSIDPALKRSGRMGLIIEFSPPDREGKRTLLEHYLEDYLDDDVAMDVETLSYFFDARATAADIEEATVEAWRYAVRRSITTKVPTVLSQEDLIEVFVKRLVGPPTAFVNLPEEDLLRIAIHECGHALMALIHGIPLRLITVQPGKKSLGRCITSQVRDHIGTVEEMENQIRVGLGSIVAEEIAGVPALVGSVGDIEAINDMAVRLVDGLKAGYRTGLFNPCRVGDTRTGRVDGANPNVSEDRIRMSDLDVSDILADAYHKAKVIMNKIGREALWEVAHNVTEATTMTGAEFADMVAATGIDFHDVSR